LKDYENIYKSDYDSKGKIRTLLNTNFFRTTSAQQNDKYDPLYLREVENAFSVFELQMKPQGINTISQLTDKITFYQQEIERLAKDIENVGQSQAIQERAEEIIRKREEENLVKDQSLSEGDWQERVNDFASLNCILDMKANTQQEKKLIIEEKEIVESEEPNMDNVEGTDEEERMEDAVEIEVKAEPISQVDDLKMKIEGIEGLLEVFEKGSEQHKDIQDKIDVLQDLLSIYE